MFSQLQDSKRGSGETWAAVCFCFRKNSTCPESSLNLGSISKCTFIHFRQYKLTVGFTLLRRPAVFFQLLHPSPRTQSASTVWCPGLTATGRPAAPAPTWRRCWRASAGARLKPCGAASTVTDTSWTPPTRIQGTRWTRGVATEWCQRRRRSRGRIKRSSPAGMEGRRQEVETPNTLRQQWRCRLRARHWGTGPATLEVRRSSHVRSQPVTPHMAAEGAVAL